MNKQLNLASTLLLALLFSAAASYAATFTAAKPVWPAGMAKEKNLFIGFRAVFNVPDDALAAGCGKVILRITASTFYRVFLNGKFVGRGPARGPHEYYRVDEWDLQDFLLPDSNLLAIEVAGYNANGYGVLAQSSFLQAEVVDPYRVLASTGANADSGFVAFALHEHVKKVQRYTTQRAFTEVYRLEPGYDDWRKKMSVHSTDVLECAVQPQKKYLLRCVPYPEFRLDRPVWEVSDGSVATGLKPDSLWKYRSLTGVGPTLLGFPEKELEAIPSLELQSVANEKTNRTNRPFDPAQPLTLGRNSFHILDLGTNLTGFIGARIRANETTRLYITFDEELTGGDVDFKRLNAVNAIRCDLEPGDYEIESFEPYTLRFMKFLVLSGNCRIDEVYLREFANPEAARGQFVCSDDRLNRLFEAGRETFRQNALDIFMDCPSRERAGWLCDSYFTARAAPDLCGNTLVEKNFFENFARPDSFAFIPSGMLPMCYPADQYRGIYLPTWALWFVLQLEEYSLRSGDCQTVESLRPRVLALFDFLGRYRNSEGLLEKLPGWMILEWSAANDFLEDVNYPVNMLYAMALDAAARMYGRTSLEQEARSVRRVVREQSFDGEFFVDNSVWENGRLSRTRNRTETCQYYAFLSGTATRERYPELCRKLSEEFGPGRPSRQSYAEIFPITPFIGYVLRLEVLSEWGLCDRVAQEAIAYYLTMAERTGTLWELEKPHSSRNHGFESHICHTLYRDVLGLYRVDTVNRAVVLRFPASGQAWSAGSMPVPGGSINLKWWVDGDDVKYRLSLPDGYSLKVLPIPGRNVIRTP